MTVDFFYRHKAGVVLFLYLTVATILLTIRIEPVITGLRAALYFLVSGEVATTGELFNKIDNLGGQLFRLVRADAENQILRAQNAMMSKRDVERDVLEEENNRFRNLLGLKEKVFSSGIIAEVLGPDPRSWFRTITIDKGAKDGVLMSAAVIEGSSGVPLLVGRILDVQESSSKVLLITDVESAVSAQVKGKSYLGLIEGRSRPVVMMTYLPSQSDVAVGDEVVSAALGGVFPPGILIGKIDRVELSEDGFFKEALVVPSAEFSSLKEVMVLSRIGSEVKRQPL